VSARRSVPAGVQFIAGVGGFAAGLVSLFALLGIYVAELALAARFVPMLLLGVGHVVSLYGLVRLRRWGYRWTRRLFAVTLLVNLPGLRTGDPITLGTVAFSVFVLGYLWLADTKTFRPRPTGGDPTGGDAGDPGDPGNSDEAPIRIEDVDAGDGDGAESDTSADPDPLAGETDSAPDQDDGADADGDDESHASDTDAGDETGE